MCMLSSMNEIHIPRVGDTKFDVLAAVVDHWETASFGPSVEELRETVGLATRSSVQFHINDLIRDGFLHRVPRKHRALRATPRGEKLVSILREEEDAQATG